MALATVGGAMTFPERSASRHAGQAYRSRRDDVDLVGWEKERKRRAHQLSPNALLDGGHAALCPPYKIAIVDVFSELR